MKLKIKNSTLAAASPLYIFIYILLALIALFVLQWLLSHLQPVTAVWKDLLAYAREKSLLSYAFIYIFPWLVGLWVVLFFCSRANRWNKARKTNPIVCLSFEERGVLLGHKNPRADRYLPYAETDLSVCLPVLVTYNKYGQAFAHLAELEITFSHTGKTYSVRHKGKLPFVQTLLDEGKKFRTASATVRRMETDKLPSQSETNFIHFLEEQLENHRRYGQMLPEYPAPRAAWLVLGLMCLAVIEWGVGMVLSVFLKTNASPVLLALLCIFAAGPLVWAVWNIQRYRAFRAASQKLQTLKKASSAAEGATATRF